MGGGWSGICGSLAVPDALVLSVFPVGLWMGPGATPGTRGSEEAWLALSLLWASSEGRPVRGAPLPALPSCMSHTCCPSPLTPALSGRVRCPSISPRETGRARDVVITAAASEGCLRPWGRGRGVGVCGGSRSVRSPRVGHTRRLSVRKSSCALALEGSPWACAIGRRPAGRGGAVWRNWSAARPGREPARPRGGTSPSCGQIPDPQDPDTAGRPGRPPRSGSRDVSGSQCIENVFALSCSLLSVQWQSLQNNVHPFITKRFRVEKCHSPSEPCVNRHLLLAESRAPGRCQRSVKGSELSAVLGSWESRPQDSMAGPGGL